jgi:fluoride exporter
VGPGHPGHHRARLTSPHRFIRPFLGVGILGGYTTFSTASVDVEQLALDGRPVLAASYLLGTVLAALAAVAVGTISTRAVGLGWRRWRARHPAGR